MFVLFVLYNGRQVQESTSSSCSSSSSLSSTMDVRYKRGHPLLPYVRPSCPLPWTSGTREDILFLSMFVLLFLYHGRQVHERTSSSLAYSSSYVLFHGRQVQERTSFSLACSSSLSSTMYVRYKRGHCLALNSSNLNP